MTNDVKVSLTILGIPGSTRHYLGRRKVKSIIRFKDKRTKEIVEKTLYYKVPTYEYEPISQRVNLTGAFFNYATSKECPAWYSDHGNRRDLVRRWEKMSWRERLEAHLLRMCLDKNGSSYIYHIFED